MEQQGEGRGKREENKQLQPQVPAAPQPQQHQKCPRCDSFNTKFCYYNNYSLSQPRYYCKSCKRYWTQGGTLRNIPVGGSRKGKRFNKTSSSSSSSSGYKPYNRSSSQPLDQEMVQIQNQSNLAGPSPPTVVPSPIGGYLSSLSATVHSLNPPSQSQSQSLNFGFNDDVVSLIGSQQHSQILPPSRLYHMGKGGAGEVGSSLFPAPAPQEGGFFIIPPSSMVNATIASSQSFMIMNDANSHRAPSFASSSLWSTISTTSISGNNNSLSNIIRGGSSSSLIPNRLWPHLPGYDPPPE